VSRIGGRRWRRLLAQVLDEDGDICWLCGKPGATSGDHVIPVSVRPDLEFERWNVRPCHVRCNTRRGNRPVRPAPRVPTSRPW
jgi:5-methylcytosine-specific restriction endonuclease McrA